MNAIEVYNSVQLYIDRSKGARYYFQEINKAVNDAIKMHIDDITDTANQNKLSGLDRFQVFRDELYTLMKANSSVPTLIGPYNSDVLVNHIDFPADYRAFAALSVTIDGNTTYGRETTYNERGPMLECSFRKPTNNKVYFLEDSTGLKIYRGVTGTASSSSLDYVKQPVEFNMGNELNLIDAGVGVLSLSTSYTAFEDSEYNGIIYPSGTVFSTNGVLADLTSGQVILTSLLVTIELPAKTHPDIAKRAAAILAGVVEDFQSSAFAEKESKN
ncbi:MAG: hypothetical protein ACOVJ5_00750 [Gloeomargaritales cyanobacterium]